MMGYMYPKTNGQAVTTKIKLGTAPNGGRMLLDDQLKEMIDLLWPVGSLCPPCFADNMDHWLDVMAYYDMQATEGLGQLVAVADYPVLFGGCGYGYGWSHTNPGPTTTYTGTDVDGNPITYIHPADLDLAGNALPVPEGESPAYFRLPNLAGMFLRIKGESSYVNRWTDTDGNQHEIYTTYAAEMYRRMLDAQRGIWGRIRSEGGSGLFYTSQVTDSRSALIPVDSSTAGYQSTGGLEARAPEFNLNSSRVVPLADEIMPASLPTSALLRIA